jgi:hypothetical protein
MYVRVCGTARICRLSAIKQLRSNEHAASLFFFFGLPQLFLTILFSSFQSDSIELAIPYPSTR